MEAGLYPRSDAWADERAMLEAYGAARWDRWCWDFKRTDWCHCSPCCGQVVTDRTQRADFYLMQELRAGNMGRPAELPGMLGGAAGENSLAAGEISPAEAHAYVGWFRSRAKQLSVWGDELMAEWPPKRRDDVTEGELRRVVNREAERALHVCRVSLAVCSGCSRTERCPGRASGGGRACLTCLASSHANAMAADSLQQGGRSWGECTSPPEVPGLGCGSPPGGREGGGSRKRGRVEPQGLMAGMLTCRISSGARGKRGKQKPNKYVHGHH